MNLKAFIRQCDQLGITIMLVGNTVRLGGRVPPALMNQLEKNHAKIVWALRPQKPPKQKQESSIMKAYLGIDPGKKGGIAIIHPDGAEAWRYPGDIVSAAELLQEIRTHHAIILAVIEQVASRPGQGVRSMFSFGQNYGAWLGMLAAYGIPHTTVTPHKWQKAIMDAGTGDTKERSLNMARRLFPGIDLKHKADDGKSDALLMAMYARRMDQRGGL